jgi:hypothetical protein
LHYWAFLESQIGAHTGAGPAITSCKSVSTLILDLLNLHVRRKAQCFSVSLHIPTIAQAAQHSLVVLSRPFA